MIVDGLVYVGASRFGYELTVKDVLVQLALHEIDAAVIAPTHRPDHDFSRGNEYVAKAAQESGGRLIPTARVDPWDGELAYSQLTLAVTVHGARALFLHPAEEHFRINQLRVHRLALVAAELDVPIIVASGFPFLSEAPQIRQFASWVPGIPIILTNGGQYNISGLGLIDASLALQLDNVYVHTTGVYRDDWIGRIVAQLGPQRLLYASAAPIGDFSYEMKRVQLAHVPAAAKPIILGESVPRLFRLEEK